MWTILLLVACTQSLITPALAKSQWPDPFPITFTEYEDYDDLFKTTTTTTTTTAAPKLASLVTKKSKMNSIDCGLSAAARIIGGTEAKLRQDPWLALLKYRRKRQVKEEFLCGGSLISHFYVLTAAHCVDRRALIDKDIVGVRLGEHDLGKDPDCDSTGECNPPPKDIDVIKTIVHEKWLKDRTNFNDIALLKLKEYVGFTNEIRAICLPTGTEDPGSLLGQRLTVAGWGETQTGQKVTVKMRVDVPVKNVTICLKRYGRYKVHQDGSMQLCAGGETKKDSCTGDSGGPLMSSRRRDGEMRYRVHVEGVVSFGPNPCGKTDRPGVYSRVSYFMPWIKSHMDITPIQSEFSG